LGLKTKLRARSKKNKNKKEVKHSPYKLRPSNLRGPSNHPLFHPSFPKPCFNSRMMVSHMPSGSRPSTLDACPPPPPSPVSPHPWRDSLDGATPFTRRLPSPNGSPLVSPSTTTSLPTWFPLQGPPLNRRCCPWLLFKTRSPYPTTSRLFSPIT